MGAVWTEHTSKSTGKVYYYNTATKKSTFKKPEELREDRAARDACDEERDGGGGAKPAGSTKPPPTATATATAVSADAKHGEDGGDGELTKDVIRSGADFKLSFTPPLYKHGLDVVHPNIEVFRFNLFNRLRNDLHDVITRKMRLKLVSGRKTSHMIFTSLWAQFVFLQHACRDSFSDPLLPDNPTRFDGLIRDFTYLTRPKMSEKEARETVKQLNIVQRCRWFNEDMHKYIRDGDWKTARMQYSSRRTPPLSPAMI